ncbi:MAG TPA: EscN/YscN/HrcN family type III secretion system ATPase, partial [Planctomycetota bacterium]|nr:EscN/YscN/HrcN family type III secretion system ATPase [Planctomycetota bacterium]
MIDSLRAKQAIHEGARPFWRGRVDRVSGVMVEALGAPAAIGEMCRIELRERQSVLAEVVGFRGPTTLLMPHGELAGIAPKQAVIALGRQFSVPVGLDLFGRVVDG